MIFDKHSPIFKNKAATYPCTLLLQMNVSPLKLFIYFIFILAAVCEAAPLRKKNYIRRLSDNWDTLNQHKTEVSDIVVVSGSKRIPIKQFTYSWGVSFPIWIIFTAMERSGIVAEFVLAVNAYSIFVCLPGFYGYFPSFDPNSQPADISFKLVPFLKLRKLTFPESKYTVSSSRSNMIQLIWIFEILIFIAFPMPQVHMQETLGPFYCWDIVYFTGFFMSFMVFGAFDYFEQRYSMWADRQDKQQLVPLL